MDKFEQLKSTIEFIGDDVERFYVKGNKSAGVRVRKAMQPFLFPA